MSRGVTGRTSWDDLTEWGLVQSRNPVSPPPRSFALSFFSLTSPVFIDWLLLC